MTLESRGVLLGTDGWRIWFGGGWRRRGICLRRIFWPFFVRELVLLGGRDGKEVGLLFIGWPCSQDLRIIESDVLPCPRLGARGYSAYWLMALASSRPGGPPSLVSARLNRSRGQCFRHEFLIQGTTQGSSGTLNCLSLGEVISPAKIRRN